MRPSLSQIGIVSSIGYYSMQKKFWHRLKTGPAHVASPEMTEHGFRSRVAGTLKD